MFVNCFPVGLDYSRYAPILQVCMFVGSRMPAPQPMPKKAAFVDTPLHATLRHGLINALEEKDWTVAELRRQMKQPGQPKPLAHSTISDFINATQGIGVDSLYRCLVTLRLSPQDFLARCDRSWQPRRLKEIEGVATHAPPHEPDAKIRAAIDTLRAAADVAATLIAGETGSPEAPTPKPLRRRSRPRGPAHS